jgi:thiamine pyrophosphate-dependent acetolactate synthase large subunit-like protein
MVRRKASDVFVECLEAEGVRYVFGIPGEETLDLNESLADSSITFVPVRHEQGGAYMADAYGRLTGRAGVCLGTLGPGATNLLTAVADAFLDRAPLVALTGQSSLERMHKESHQYLDLTGILRPVVKWNARVASPDIIPEVVRKAFKLAGSEKPGPTHIELPEDVMALPLDASPLPRHDPVLPEPGPRELQVAAELIDAAQSPIALVGNGAIRGGAARALRAFVHTAGIPVAETFMAKGLMDDEAATSPASSRRLRELELGALHEGTDDDHFPLRPARVLSDIRAALRSQDMLVSDVGLHKLWIGRIFPAHEPGTVLIANGLAGMGFALPTAIAAKLVYPERHVVAVSGDGGFLMNSQELETAVRLRTPVVNVVWENGEYGSIAWKQDKRFGRHFGVSFGNPDFVKLADAFGMPAWRCSTAGEFSQHLTDALALDLPSLIVVPIDYSIDVAISEELGAETVAT